jgi:acylphosphatase
MKRVEGELGRRAYRVVGRVQGVGFRWWTRRTAAELGVGGWVRNEVDGSVVVHATGTPDALQRLEQALGRGPLGARVDRLERIAPDAGLQVGDFKIEA